MSRQNRARVHVVRVGWKSAQTWKKPKSASGQKGPKFWSFVNRPLGDYQGSSCVSTQEISNREPCMLVVVARSFFADGIIHQMLPSGSGLNGGYEGCTSLRAANA